VVDVNWVDGRITDEGLDHMRSYIGRKSIDPAWNHVVTSDSIWHYALGIGDDNPLWWDPSYAQTSRWGGRIAPPSYLYSHFGGPRLTPAQGMLSVEEWLPGVMGLWASDSWRWVRPAYVGETIRGECSLIEVSEHVGKFGGRNVTQVERIQLITEKDELIAEVDRAVKRFERRETRDRSPYLDLPSPKYTEEDRASFEQQYENEATFRRGSSPRYLDDVRVGESLGKMLKGPLSLTNLVGFMQAWGGPLCATNRMHHQLIKLHPAAKMIHPVSGIVDNIEAPHWDREFARAGGMSDGYDFGCQRISWFSHFLTDWAGDDAMLTELSVRLLKPNFIGDVTWLTGEITEILEDAEGFAAVEVRATNQRDQVTAIGKGKIRLPRAARAPSHQGARVS
jgi:acyl dehydratase